MNCLSSQRPPCGTVVIQCWSCGCQLGQGEPQCIGHPGVFLSSPGHWGCTSEGVDSQWPGEHTCSQAAQYVAYNIPGSWRSEDGVMDCYMNLYCVSAEFFWNDINIYFQLTSLPTMIQCGSCNFIWILQMTWRLVCQVMVSGYRGICFMSNAFLTYLFWNMPC